MTQRLVLGLEMGENEVKVTYGEMFANGLALQHEVHVPRDSDYEDELAAVQEALDALLTDVLQDAGNMTPIDLDQPDDETDEELGSQ